MVISILLVGGEDDEGKTSTTEQSGDIKDEPSDLLSV